MKYTYYLFDNTYWYRFCDDSEKVYCYNPESEKWKHSLFRKEDYLIQFEFLVLSSEEEFQSYLMLEELKK